MYVGGFELYYEVGIVDEFVVFGYLLDVLVGVVLDFFEVGNAGEQHLVFYD